MSNIRNMEYRTFLLSYFESGPMDQMLCKEIFILALVAIFFSRAEQVKTIMSECLLKTFVWIFFKIWTNGLGRYAV